MPSLRSFSPNVKPSSDFSTTKARDVVAALAVGVGDGEHGVELRDTGVGDPRLLPGEHPVVAVAHGARIFIAAVSEPASRSDSP